MASIRRLVASSAHTTIARNYGSLCGDSEGKHKPLDLSKGSYKVEDFDADKSHFHDGGSIHNAGIGGLKGVLPILMTKIVLTKIVYNIGIVI